MIPADTPDAPGGAAPPKKNGAAWQLRIILVVTILPVIAAYTLYFAGVKAPVDSTINNGVLLTPPKPVPELLEHAHGDVPGFVRNSKWRILIPITADCGADCQHNLYTTRQVHTRLGREAERIERFAVNIGGPAGAAFLADIQAEHPRLRTFSVSEQDWQHWLRETNAPSQLHSQHFYLLVDQLGSAMMFYNAEHHGNQLLKDVKRVLRFSPNT